MKHLVTLLFIYSTSFAQSDFIKKYSLAQDVGSILTGKSIVVRAKKAIPLMGDVKEFNFEAIDTIRTGETAILMDLYNIKNELWVVRYKSRYRTAFINTELFEFDKVSYEKVFYARKSFLESEADKDIKKFTQDLKKSAIKKYGAKFGMAVLNQEVEIGMSPDIVEVSWGIPDKKIVSKKATGTSSIWHYYARNSTVVFFDGKVYEVTTSN